MQFIVFIELTYTYLLSFAALSTVIVVLLQQLPQVMPRGQVCLKKSLQLSVIESPVNIGPAILEITGNKQNDRRFKNVLLWYHTRIHYYHMHLVKRCKLKSDTLILFICIDLCSCVSVHISSVTRASKPFILLTRTQ